MKILGCKLERESNIFGRKLVYTGKILGKKQTKHQRAHHNETVKEITPSSNLEKTHQNHTSGDIHRYMPAENQINMVHYAKPNRDPRHR